MHESLDFTLEEFENHLQKAISVIIDRYATLGKSPAFSGVSEALVKSWFDEALPAEGEDIELVLDKIKEQVFDPATLNIGSNMYAYVMGGGNHVSVIGDLLTSALNQNVAKWHLAPSLTEIERRVISWAAQFIGLDNHTSGAIVTGGSAANLTGLTIARNIYFSKDDIRKKGLFSAKPFTVYGSVETHNSVTKSVEQLGIGSQYYRQIAVLDDFTIDPVKLKRQIELDINEGFTPFCIIGNAGTVNTGAIDPLSVLADYAEKYKLWFHVDGCYGGAASSLPELNDFYTGIERADSVALDFHKWLYQPFEIGCVLVKGWNNLRDTYHTPASYLQIGGHDKSRFNFTEHHFDLSRNGKSLKVWMTFKVYGAERIREMIRKDIDMASYLSQRIAGRDVFELMSDSKLGISCFRYIGDGRMSERQLNMLNERIALELERDGRIFITPTTLNGQLVIRACVINHRIGKDDIDFLFTVVSEVSDREWKSMTNSSWYIAMQ